MNAPEPISVEAALFYAKHHWHDDPKRTMALLKAAVPKNPKELLDLERSFVVHNEWYERMNNGEWPYHSAFMDDMFFKYTKLHKYLAASLLADSWGDHVVGAFALGERERVEDVIIKRGSMGHVLETFRGRPGFYNSIFDGDLPVRIDLPKVTTERHCDGPNVVWLSCSGTYQSFATTLIQSIRETSDGALVHLHVMDPLKYLDRTADGWSYEYCNGDRGYYHAVRFIRLYQWMCQHQGNVWLLDVDALIRNDLCDLFPMLDDADVAMRARPGRLEPWNQVNACVVGFKNNQDGRQYASLIARYVYHFRHLLHWGIDQLAMFGCYEYLRPKVATLNPKQVDYDYQDDGIVWCNSGGAKHHGNIDPRRLKYAMLEQHYKDAQ